MLTIAPAPAQTTRPPVGGTLAERFKQLDRDGDGKVSTAEYSGPLFRQMDRNRDGLVTLEEALGYYRDGVGRPAPHNEEVAGQKQGEPPLKMMPDCDATRDASGRGQRFESIVVPGFTSIQEGMNGVAVVDLNKDGGRTSRSAATTSATPWAAWPRTASSQPAGACGPRDRLKGGCPTNRVPPEYVVFSHVKGPDAQGYEVRCRSGLERRAADAFGLPPKE